MSFTNPSASHIPCFAQSAIASNHIATKMPPESIINRNLDIDGLWLQQVLCAVADDHTDDRLMSELVKETLLSYHANPPHEWTQKNYALEESGFYKGYRYGIGLLFNQHFESAKAVLQPVVIRAGREASLGMRLSLAYVNSRLCDWRGVSDALSPLYEGLTSVQPNSSTDVLHVRALHHLGRLDEALHVAEGALVTRPTPFLVDAVGLIYLDTHQLKNAAALHCARANGLRTQEWWVLGGYVALSQGKLLKAQAQFKASLGDRPNCRAALGLGLSQTASGDFSNALHNLHSAASLMPENLGTWHALAWLQMMTGQWDAAQASFEAAKAHDRYFGDNYGGLALVALARGLKDRAGELARTGLRLDPSSVNSGLALSLLKSGRGMDFSEEALTVTGLEVMLKKHIGAEAVQEHFEGLLKQAARRVNSSWHFPEGNLVDPSSS